MAGCRKERGGGGMKKGKGRSWVLEREGVAEKNEQRFVLVIADFSHSV